MSLVVVIDKKENRENTMNNLHFSHGDAKQISSTGIELESGTAVLHRTPNKAVRGLKPDVVILRCEVEDEVYDTYIKNMVAGHGVLIDER